MSENDNQNTVVPTSNEVSFPRTSLFTESQKKEFKELLNNIDEDIISGLKSFQNGKILAAMGSFIQLQESLHQLEKFATVEVTGIFERFKNKEAIDFSKDSEFSKKFISFLDQAITELKDEFSHSIVIPFAKSICYSKDFGIDTLLSNKLIKGLINMSPDAAMKIGTNPEEIGETYKTILDILNNEHLKLICDDIYNISNIYDNSLNSLSENIYGVVDAILHPADLFTGTVGIAGEISN